MTAYAFDEQGAKRIVRAVKRVEGTPIDLVGRRLPPTPTAAPTIQLADIIQAGTEPGRYQGVRYTFVFDDENGNWVTAQGDTLPELQEANNSAYVPMGFYEVRRGTRQVNGNPEPLAWFVGWHGTTPFLANMTQTGGSAGNATTACSFTYTVAPVGGILHGDVQTTGINPTSGAIYKRPSLGALTAATQGLFMVFQGATLLRCVWCNEVPVVAECD